MFLRAILSMNLRSNGFLCGQFIGRAVYYLTDSEVVRGRLGFCCGLLGLAVPAQTPVGLAAGRIV